MWADVAIIIGAYLFGSLPHLHFLARLRGIDLNGDFHQDLWYRGGKIIGVVGVAGEFVKGVVPVLVARALDFDIAVVALAGLAAVCGQMWPVFTRFDGEKGNSIALAMAITLIPVPALIAMVPVITAIIIRTTPRIMARLKTTGDTAIIGGHYSRILPLGMLACFLVLPFAAWGFGETPSVVWCCVRRIAAQRITAHINEFLEFLNPLILL